MHKLVQLQGSFLLLEQQLLEFCLLKIDFFIPVANSHTWAVTSSALQLLFGVVLHVGLYQQHCTNRILSAQMTYRLATNLGSKLRV